jgi:hypothetical protein
VTTPPLTAERLHALAKIYEQGPVSDLMERTLQKLLCQEAAVCHAQVGQLQADLAEFAQKSQRSSRGGYQQSQAGQTGDAMEYGEWPSLIQMTDKLTKRLRLLITYSYLWADAHKQLITRGDNPLHFPGLSVALSTSIMAKRVRRSPISP